MSRFLKVVAIALLVLLAANSVFAQEQPKAAWPAYLLSIFLGYGLGHYYCGENGTPFLIVDAVTATCMVVMGSGFSSSSSLSILGFGSAIIMVSRIYEMIDIFGAVLRAKKAGRVAEVIPVIDVDIKRASFGFGVSLRF